MVANRRPAFRLPFLTRARVEADVQEELRFHLRMMAHELERQGWSATDAETEACRRFGDLEYTQRYCGAVDLERERERKRMARIDELSKDLRYTLRSLRNAPGFTLVVLLTLALGIGANTAIFSVVRSVLLEPLPFGDSHQLVRVWHENPTSGITQSRVSEPDFLDWKRETTLATSVGGVFHMNGLGSLDLTGDGPPVRVSSALVGDGFFETLRVTPLHGRVIGNDDQLEGRNRVVMLGHSLWSTRYNSDPAIVGRTVQLNGEAFTVIGIMPPNFSYPADVRLDAWVPLSLFGADDIGRSRGSQFLSVVARLAPGATPAQLQQELSRIAERLSAEHPENPGWTQVRVMPIRESIVGNVERPLSLLMGAVFLVLLITCANVASLLLARATARHRELAVRAALGAGRTRILRQLLTESLVLAVAGGVLGVLLAMLAIDLFKTSAYIDLPRLDALRVDLPVLAFAFGMSLLAGVLFGLVPSLRATGASLQQALRSGGRGNVGSGTRLRSALVVVQVALAVVLVTGATLTTKSFARLMSVDVGFKTENALFLEMSVADSEDQPARFAYYNRVLDAIRQVPGVTAAGSIRDLPTRGIGETVRPQLPGAMASADNQQVVAQLHHVSTGFFEAMQVPVVRGRVHTEQDIADAPVALVVNEEFARRYFPTQDATTRSLQFGNSPPLQIVGVVGDIRHDGPTAPVEPAVYIHAMQNFRSRMNIVVRTVGNPLDVSSAVRQAIWDVNPTQTIGTVASLEQVLGRSVSRPRLLASLFAMFGLLGLTIGALGVYGVLAYSVTQRQQEIGVRVALGASPELVQAMFVKHGLLLAALGTTLGVAGAALATGVMQSVLYGIAAADVTTFVQVAAGVVFTALIASWIPARRATRVDPMVALREE